MGGIDLAKHAVGDGEEEIAVFQESSGFVFHAI
jgi:hypothetical protein